MEQKQRSEYSLAPYNEAELINKLRLYEQMLHNFPEAFIISDGNIITYINKEAFRLIGLQSDESIIGRPIADFVHPSQHQLMQEQIERTLSSEEPVVVHEMKLRYNDLEMVTDVSGISLIDMDGNAVILTVIRDITERKQSEELLIRSEKLSVIGQLAAGVAHEIRNPLAALKGFTQLLKSRLPDYVSYFNIMISEIDRINLIVNEFMTLAKPHYSQLSVGRLEPIIQSVLSILETQATLLSVVIKVDMENELPLVLCNENQLKQVFLNIIKNALEAMPKGGEVLISAAAIGNDKVQINIKDEGQGIPPELIDKLGEPFVTTKEKGTGLGLMISSRIIEEHKGALRFSSSPDEGTIVMITLPAYMQEHSS